MSNLTSRDDVRVYFQRQESILTDIEGEEDIQIMLAKHKSSLFKMDNLLDLYERKLKEASTAPEIRTAIKQIRLTLFMKKECMRLIKKIKQRVIEVQRKNYN